MNESVVRPARYGLWRKQGMMNGMHQIPDKRAGIYSYWPFHKFLNIDWNLPALVLKWNWIGSLSFCEAIKNIVCSFMELEKIIFFL